jgi:hypothetical protein
MSVKFTPMVTPHGGWFTGVYGPQFEVEKIDFLNELWELRNLCEGPRYWLGISIWFIHQRIKTMKTWIGGPWGVSGALWMILISRRFPSLVEGTHGLMNMKHQHSSNLFRFYVQQIGKSYT